jgi:hypothetical protein
MRITISIDKDVVARLERLRKERPFKALINDALRAGLDEIERASSGGQAPSPVLMTETRYSLTPVKGQPRRTDLDNVWALLSEIDS